MRPFGMQMRRLPYVQGSVCVRRALARCPAHPLAVSCPRYRPCFTPLDQHRHSSSWASAIGEINQEMEGLLGEFQDVDLSAPGQPAVPPTTEGRPEPVRTYTDRNQSASTGASSSRTVLRDRDVPVPTTEAGLVAQANLPPRSAVPITAVVFHSEEIGVNAMKAIKENLGRVYPLESILVCYEPANSTDDVGALVKTLHVSNANAVIILGAHIVQSTNYPLFKLLARAYPTILYLSPKEINKLPEGAAAELLYAGGGCRMVVDSDVGRGVCAAIGSILSGNKSCLT